MIGLTQRLAKDYLRRIRHATDAHSDPLKACDLGDAQYWLWHASKLHDCKEAHVEVWMAKVG